MYSFPTDGDTVPMSMHCARPPPSNPRGAHAAIYSACVSAGVRAAPPSTVECFRHPPGSLLRCGLGGLGDPLQQPRHPVHGVATAARHILRLAPLSERIRGTAAHPDAPHRLRDPPAVPERPDLP